MEDGLGGCEGGVCDTPELRGCGGVGRLMGLCMGFFWF